MKKIVTKNIVVHMFAFFRVLLFAPVFLGTANAQDAIDGAKNTVIVLGMIHSGHLTSERYSLPYLRRVIEEINPDYVLTEIPPDRLGDAMAGFVANGVVSEARVKRFPEYKDVLFPMTKGFNFKIIPTAGWTAGMAKYRREALARISKDPARTEDWATYQAANKAMREKMKGREDDPFFVNSDEYDAITKAGLTPYAQLFAHDLGRGDWESINSAHYTLIEAALDNHQNEGATILITYGAGHKYWFLEQLRKRDDIILKAPTQYLTAAMKK